MDFFLKECSLLNLLPHSSEMQIKSAQEALSVLKIIEILLIHYKTAFSNLLSEEYSLFDPLVGENSCQIRGYMLYYLWSTKSQITNTTQLKGLINTLNRTLTQIYSLKSNLETYRKDLAHNEFTEKSSLPLSDFLVLNKIQIDFSEEILTILMIYFLSRYTSSNEAGIHIGINYPMLCSELVFSKTLARRIIHLYQTKLSDISCRFIQYLAKEMAYIYPHYHLILNKFIFHDDDGRSVLPCYLSMDILLHHILLNQVPIVLMAYKDTDKLSKDYPFAIFCLKATTNGFLLKQQAFLSEKTPCVVFRGISNFSHHPSTKIFNHFTKRGIKKILLASTARHPQYPGKMLKELKEDPFQIVAQKVLTPQEHSVINQIREEFLTIKEWAFEKGCCLENHDTFFVTHIFCDQLKNYQQMSYDIERLGSFKSVLNGEQKYSKEIAYIT